MNGCVVNSFYNANAPSLEEYVAFDEGLEQYVIFEYTKYDNILNNTVILID